MKKLTYLFLALLIVACTTDDSTSDDNDNQLENVIKIGNQLYPIEKAVLQNYGLVGDDFEAGNCPNCYELYLVFGESTLPNNIFSSPYTYKGYYIDISYLTENIEGEGDFSTEGSDYDITFDNTSPEGEKNETWVSITPGSLSVEKSGNIYTVAFNSTDENGNIIELYYNGQISYWEN